MQGTYQHSVYLLNCAGWAKIQHSGGSVTPWRPIIACLFSWMLILIQNPDYGETYRGKAIEGYDGTGQNLSLFAAPIQLAFVM